MIAPLTRESSSCGVLFTACCSSACVSEVSLWAIFSAPSKQRYPPPSIKSGTKAHGASAFSSSAMGKMMTSLLRSEPLAIRQIIGSSRAGVTSETYCGVTAASSITTPAAFADVFAVSAATSSTDDAAVRAINATSSSSASKPPAIPGSFPSDPSGTRLEITTPTQRVCTAWYALG